MGYFVEFEVGFETAQAQVNFLDNPLKIHTFFDIKLVSIFDFMEKKRFESSKSYFLYFFVNYLNKI